MHVPVGYHAAATAKRRGSTTDAEDAHLFRTWAHLIVDGLVLLVIAWHAFGEWRSVDRRVRWLDF